MHKIEINQANLTVFTQSAISLPLAQPIHGSLTISTSGLSFVQSVSRPRSSPNPKLFDGQYLSLVLNKQGHLMLYPKGGNLLDIPNLKVYQASVANELNTIITIAAQLRNQ